MKIAGMTLFAASLALLPATALMADENNFSTTARVHYVLDCMEAHPDMNVYESINKCSCVVDKLGAQFTEMEFDDADTAFRYKNLPADKGGAFRDDKLAGKLMNDVEKAQTEAYQSCLLK